MVDNVVKLFGELDNRVKDIFAVLTYPSEITEKTVICYEGNETRLHELVTFVAIKNGEHQSKGFAFFSEGISKFAPGQGEHVANIQKTVLQFFGVSNKS